MLFELVVPFLLFGTLYLGFLSGVLSTRGGEAGGRGRLAVATAVVLLITGTLSCLQFAFPQILEDLRRQSAGLAHGQWWRLFTPLLVQDGGWQGALFNLVFLVLLGFLAERLLGWRRWLLLYFGTGLISEVLAYTWFPQGFAGNSVANFGLAAGLIVFALASRRPPALVLAALGALCGLSLLLLGNLHGAAFLVGLLLALASTAVGRRFASA